MLRRTKTFNRRSDKISLPLFYVDRIQVTFQSCLTFHSAFMISFFRRWTLLEYVNDKHSYTKLVYATAAIMRSNVEDFKCNCLKLRHNVWYFICWKLLQKSTIKAMKQQRFLCYVTATLHCRLNMAFLTPLPDLCLKFVRQHLFALKPGACQVDLFFHNWQPLRAN